MGTSEANAPAQPVEEKTKKEKKNGLSRWAIAGLVALVLLILLACAALSYFIFGPLGESLFISEATATPTSASSGPVPTSEPADRPSACAGTGTMKILVLGVDVPYTSEPKGADAIRLMHLDFTNSEVTVVAMPRDLWVDTPILQTLNIQNERLGITYYHAKEHPPADKDPTVYGTQVLAQVLYDNFGFVADHYITVHIDNFDNIVNAIGGVEVNVPTQYQSVNYVFSPGVQTMTGDQALEYASNLLRDDTPWDRFNRQDLLLQAIYDEVTSPQIITKIPNLVSEFSNTITTDFSVAQLTDLSCLLNEVSMDEVQYVEIEESMVTRQPDSPLLYPNYDEITTLLEGVFE